MITYLLAESVPWIIRTGDSIHGIVEKKYVIKNYSNIDDQNSMHLKIKISTIAKECIKRDINDLLIFYSVHKDKLHLVRQAWYVLLLIKLLTYFTKVFCYLYKQEIINNNNEILRWMEALHSNGANINPLYILNLSSCKYL